MGREMVSNRYFHFKNKHFFFSLQILTLTKLNNSSTTQKTKAETISSAAKWIHHSSQMFDGRMPSFLAKWSSFFSDVGWKNAVLLGEADEAVVALAHSADLAADGVSLVIPRHPTGLLVDLGDVDLHRGMITGSDDSVRRGAFSGDVKVDVFSGFVLHLD